VRNRLPAGLVAFTHRLVAAPWAFGVAALGVTGASVFASYYVVFTGFRPYDDEGYILVMLREYARGGVLYDDVYSQYGPSYFQIVNPIFASLGLAFSHDNARLIVIALWAIASLACAIAVYRFTSNVPAAVACHLLVTVNLIPLRNEPLHPGVVLVLILSLLALLATFLDGSRRSLAFLLIGGMTALAVLIKINVGAFAVAALAFTLISELGPRSRTQTLLARIIAGVLILLPAALMFSRLNQQWARTYAILVSCAAAAVLLTLLRGASGALAPRHVAATIAGFGTVAVLSLGFTLLRGTTISGLLEGVLTGPVQHPARFAIPLGLSLQTLWWSVFGLGIAVVFAWTGRRAPAVHDVVVGPGRVAAGALVLWTSYSGGLKSTTLSVALPLVWTAVATATPGRTIGRRLLVLMAVFQSLHAYPIAGSQMSWATFLLIPVGATALADGVAWIQESRPHWIARIGASPAFPSVLVAGVLLSFGLSSFRTNFGPVRQAYEAAVPLDLPGATRVHVNSREASVYQRLVHDVSSRCDALITLPGFNSLHLFTGIEPPTRLNTTAWFTMLTQAQQNTIVRRLAGARGTVCAVRNATMIALVSRIARRTDLEDVPLAQYVRTQFVPVARIGHYEIMVRGGSIVPGSLASE